MKRFFKGRIKNILYSAAAIILMWLTWLVAYYAAGNSLLVPSIGDTVKEFFGFFAQGEFWLALLNTFWRTLAAFLVSFVLGALFAALAQISSGVRAALKPLMAFVRILPTLAALLLILKWVEGDKNLAPIIVTFLVLFPMIYAQVCAAADGISGDIKQMAALYRIPVRERVFKIYLPMVLPNVLSQTGANFSLGIKIMISAEVLAFTSRGLGGMMQYANIAGYTARLAALTVAAVILGLIVEIALSQLTRITKKWDGSAQ